MFKSLARLLVCAGILASCASTGKAVAKLEPGMAKQQVLAIMGEPADRSFRGTDEAWQYQEIAGFGQCKYTTVWISNGKLVGVSSRRGGSVAGCGLGSRDSPDATSPSQPRAVARVSRVRAVAVPPSPSRQTLKESAGFL
jgi:SmpA / OmlA family